MSIKKCLILILIMSLGVVHTGVCTANPVGGKSSPDSVSVSKEESIPGDCEEARERSERQSEVNSSCEREVDCLKSVEKKEDVDLIDEQKDSCGFSEEENIEVPAEITKLTDNGKEIVRSLQNGVGFNLDILEQPNALVFSKRVCDVYKYVKAEPALCTVPEGPALIVGSLHGDIVRTRESILAARIAFETGKAKSVVFMGNYANMGNFCVETLDEIFKFKLEFPDKVFLVGGPCEAKFLAGFENSEFLLDLNKKFPKENVDVVLRQIDILFKSLPVAIEVPLSSEEIVLCLFGNIPMITNTSGKFIYKELYIRDFVDLIKRLNIQYFYTAGCSFIFRSILGLDVSYCSYGLNLESFLNLIGYKYLVNCAGKLGEDIVERFDGRCYTLNNSIGYITKAGVCSFCEDIGSGIDAVRIWLDCAVRDFVKSADNSDPDVLVSLGILAEQDGNVALAKIYYEEAVKKGSASAHYELGLCYEKGKGVERDCDMAVKLFRIAGNRNYARAQDELGFCYLHTHGVTKNARIAASYYYLASIQGYTQSQYNLGVCFAQGIGVKQDVARAIMCYEKASDKGCAQAQYELGSLYEKGQGIKVDCAEAAKWYCLAAHNGHARAQYELGVCYEKGRGVSRNNFQAVKWYTLAAEQGNAQAQCELGICYKEGKGVSKDAVKAIEWYSKAADQGCIQAQYELGVCYEEGYGVSKDLTRAVELYHMAAEQGHAKAQCEMGVCYAEGKGIPQDIEQAVRWYSLSSEQGCIQAKCNLGVCYINGKGVSKDYDRAVILFREAAAKECMQAQYSLGVCYENGFGVPKDYREALRCYMLAANQGFVVAQYDLGMCYEKGFGVCQDYDEAIKWYEKAAKQGCEDAQRRIDELRSL